MSTAVAAATKLEPHPLAEKIPRMSPEEYRGLRNSIRKNGFRQAFPIILFEDKVLDGRHRAEVCAELGIEPKTEEYVGDGPAAFVVSANLERRNLSVSVRGTLATEFLPLLKKEAKERQEKGGVRGREVQAGTAPDNITQSPPGGRARDEAAQLFDVSGATVGRANRLKREAPEDFDRVLRGETTLWDAERKLLGSPGPSSGPKPQPIGPLQGKALINANAAKRQLDKLAGMYAGIAEGMDELPVARALLVASSDDTARWKQSIGVAVTALNKLKKTIREAA